MTGKKKPSPKKGAPALDVQQRLQAHHFLTVRILTAIEKCHALRQAGELSEAKAVFAEAEKLARELRDLEGTTSPRAAAAKPRRH